MRQKIVLYSLGLLLMTTFGWLAGCTHAQSEEGIDTETPVPYPLGSAVILYPSRDPLLPTSPIPYPNLLTAKAAIPTIDLSGITTLSPEQMATEIQRFKESADVTLDNNGQTVTITLNTRFFVFLDDEKYPVQSLRCDPQWIMGYISNGSFRGPDRYPIYFEPIETGSCILRNGDFAANIVIVEPTSSSPSRTPLPSITPPYPLPTIVSPV